MSSNAARSLNSSSAETRIAELELALHQANERAAAAERRLAGMLEQSGPGMLLVGPEGTIERINETMCLLLGGAEAPASWIGQPADLVFERLQSLAMQPAQYALRLSELRAAQEPVLSDELALRDGRVLALDYVLPFGSAARSELFSYRLVAEMAAPNVAKEFQPDHLLYHLPAPVAVHDLNGVVLACNQAFALLLQLPASQLLGTHLSELMPSTDHSQSWPAYLTQFNSTVETSVGQLPVLPRNGQPRQLLYHAHCINQPGQAPCVLLCALDITERVQAETELKRGKERAEASALAKEGFLANLSHEIRTPMNGVLGMARQLTKTELDQDQRELLRIIQTSGEHLLSVLNEVLDMTKISSARLELEQMSFDLRESMEEALQPLAVQAAEKGVSFHVALFMQAEPLPRVMGDAYRLNQVLINLVSNSIKFTAAEGSISIGGYLISQTETHLTAGFRITDTGIGIPADKLDHIFEDFVQASPDTARRFGGTGLGLGIARALVEQMGGTIVVESQLSSGSTFQFTVTLPRAEGGEIAPRPVLLDTGALRNRRVLVVEDNGINREVVRLLLQSWGALVDEAESGPAALALHAEHRYDAVLMDIQMPGMSGVEATIQMRLHPDLERALVPVLALTANAFRSDLDRYLKAGINDCLTKPFKEEEFYSKLVALVQAPEVPLYNLQQVHELADGEITFVERIVRSFLLHIPPTLQQIQVAAAAGQWAQVAKLVHHIKPNLIQFGVAGITQPLQLLMDQPRPGTKASKVRAAAVQQLVRQVERVLRVLPEEFSAAS
ncbi:PAS domain-containing hybrid sensor histidine kinase/response regulator [Hymenobacter sp. YC55]|uniref:PAS domain-containing hybrid sensor histidine kinase/response regulator n=1 Tax=Hymenobacter sp. YC55 TaxID=3034019 RepID=UPI0023F7568B|nr:PAS domain-containing hybrid sensor histidine kinase/response regulator [Hymenobacter sp. YC55]MDF7812608.1 ATP-binding protein [Hymenobacter sp. YC55]